MGIDESRSLHRNRSFKAKRRKGFRNLLCENLERREVMAGSVLDTDFRLLSVAPNTGEILSTTRQNTLNEAPRELIFRFAGGADVRPETLRNGIVIARSGGDGVFGPGGLTDVIVSPAYLDFEDPANRRVVVARFSETLPDDLYRVEILGVGQSNAVRNVNGDPLVPRRTLTDRDTYSFNLELGTRISAIVPQPITRAAGGTLSQARNTIDVYFNDGELYDRPVVFDPLATSNPSVVDPRFYNLIFTGNSTTPLDDIVFNPTGISFDPGNPAATPRVPAKATLTFANDIHTLGGSGTYRLRIGSELNGATYSAPLTPVVPVADPAGFLGGAFDVGTGAITGSFSTILAQEIRTVSDPLLLDFPGSSQEPGHRDIQEDRSLRSPDEIWGLPNFAPDGDPEIRTIKYNFMENQSYGLDSSGRPLFTSINEDQKQRVREIFEFYSRYLGVDFQEYTGPTAPGIFNIVVGDMIPIRTLISGPGDVLGAAGQVPDPNNPMQLWDMVILDNSEPWDNAFGFGVSQKPLGAETVPSVPASAQAGPFSFFNTAMHEIGHLLGFDHTFDLPAGTIMGSDSNGGTTNATGGIVGTRLNSPSNPLEQIFPGTIDQIHGQHLLRPDNRDVDLYRFQIAPNTSGQVRLETVAERLNDSSNVDTHLTLLRRDPATGELSIVAANNNYFSQDSFIDVPLTSGEYFVAVTGKGNEDNNPKVQDTGSGATSQGRYELRFEFKATNATSIAEQTSTSNAIGSALDGDGDGIAGGDFNFWFRAVSGYGEASASPRTLVVDKSYTGLTSDGTLLQPYKTISEAISKSERGDIIRLTGVEASRTNPTTVKAYEIGTGDFGVLSDGDRLEVPKDVTLMIDAGAILKFGNSRLLVGSDGTVDRSGAAIQVLGTPQLPVYFTSYTDQSLGEDTNVLITVPEPGDWGGIEIRNDFDRSQGRFDWEREGIFLNTISNAEMTFGGGLVGAGAQAKVTSPIELAESRPLILGNTITQSADSAISADPNSFEETLFTEPRYQNGGGFVPDYRRVGPAIYNNKITGNTINGLFLRVDTLPGQPLKTLTTHARIDDTEVSIVFGENFVIAGTPGGPLNEIAGPNTTLMIVERVPGTGFSAPVADLDLEYLVTYVDRFGQESLPSASTPIRVPAGQTSSVRLRNIPAATIDYVSRKVYRRSSPTAPFELVVVLNRDDRSFTDNNVKLPGALQTGGLLELNRARQDGSLVIDPGMIAKFRGTRLEVGIGATLIAEGTEDKPIIFTSRLDDRYGAGGTFDTNNDGLTSGAPGEWSGILARHMSTLSIDFARITFGGGDSRVPGGFATFSPIEVHQADARIANSLIERNASGRSNPGTTNRDALGRNDESAIFVLASQPVIINNIIRNNYEIINPLAPTTPDGKTAAISVDLSSLSARNVRDSGRATGFNDRETNLGIGNYGPLVFNNRLGTNGLNGMRVRGGTLTSESVWDDTDIVHILQSEVIVPDFHTYGGLRLASKIDSSLVVKADNNAGITAAGRPLDIKDRIGGTVQILGSPGFPVVITSLKDDSIGAGFDDQGGSLRDTDGNRGAAAQGDWRSIRFTPFSNDRNVDMTYEKESDQIAGSGDNDVPPKAQDIGKLAGDLKLGDENLRLGITLSGTIGAPSDMDVYRFSGVAGSTVWFDIDQTSGALDSMVELIDASGRIMALSDDSLSESMANQTLENPNYPSATAPAPIRAYPMDQLATASRNLQAAGANVDFQGTNPRDPGMRVILPGVAGTTSNYFVRVRSSNKVPGTVTNPYVISGGQTIGAYKLHLRLQEKQEIAGSTVRFADLRFSTNGVEIFGNPLHSPLLGEFAELSNDSSNSIESVLDLGNVMINDRGGVSISGTLAPATNLTPQDDIDWFDFQVGRDDDSIQTLPSTTSNTPIRIDAHQSLIFDLDYADGLGRANTQLWIFRVDPTSGNRTLVLWADDSDIQDDQPAILKGTDQNDLTRGSMGKRDAYIGPVELPPGRYTVAVTNKSVSSVGLRQFTTADISGTIPAIGLRLEPLDSVRRIAEDRFDFRPPAPLLTALSTNAEPVQVAFGEAINSTAVPNAGNVGLPNAVPFNLSDVTLFASTGRNVHFLNALTGTREAIWSTNGVTAEDFGPNGNQLNDLAVAPNGQGVGFQTATGVLTDANAGTFVGIDIGNTAPGNATSGLNTFISRLITPVANPPTFETIQVPNVGGNVGVGMIFDGLTFSRLFAPGEGATPSFWGVARRGSAAAFAQPQLDANNNTVGLRGNGITKNVLYRLTSLGSNTGQAINAGGQSRAGGQQGLGAGTSIVEAGYFVRTAGTTAGGFISGWTDAVGTVTGLTELSATAGRFFAVTDRGELMGMSIGESSAQVWSNQYVEIRDPETNALIPFSGLTAGPRNLEGGRYANLLFGIATNGRIYAFNTAGVLQPIFPRGARFVQGPAGMDGIDFSALDVNLWHATLQDSGSPGHGRLTNVTNSRPDGNGTRSLKFGFSNPTANPPSDQQIGNWNGIYNVDDFYDNTSLPGGAMGAIESDLIDLQSYSADDQPMLYFNYRVDSEGTNSPLGDNTDMLDSLRVYGVGEDGVSVLLATNNSARTSGSYDGSTPQTDEFDVTEPGPFGPIPINNNQDAFGRSYLSQELFDGQGWRQARVNLGALAGKRDVRLRFEFATGGDFRTGDENRGGQELIAVPGERLRDGQTFQLTAAASGNLAALTQTFEFDLGLVLNLPSARSLADGDGIQIDGTTFTFRTVAALPTDILLSPGATSAEIATAVRNVLAANGLTVSASTLTPNVLNVSGLNPAGTYQVTGSADPAIIAGVPGVTPGSIAVDITNAMTAVEVRDAIRTSLALAFNDPTPAGNSTNIAVYPVRGHAIVLHRITIGDRGPLQATLGRVGDDFGPRDGGPNINLFRASAKARNNTSTLVRLDDFIIGFAERGEMVLGSGSSGASLGSIQFEPTFEYENIGGPNGAGAQEIETGTYQLEIRTAPDYGKTEGQRLALEEIPMVGPKGRTYDTNDRLTKAIALDTEGLSGEIADGYAFTLSNGVNEVVFEFNVFTTTNDPAFRATIPGRFRIPLSPNATDGEIALGIRNAINDDAVRAILGVTAQINGDMFGTPQFNDAFGNIIQINGNVASNLFGDLDFTMFQDLGAGPTPTMTSIRVIEYGTESQWGEDIGDANTLREQGQIIISGAAILNAREYGINLRTAPRDLSNRFINMDLISPVGQNLPKPISTESIRRAYPGSVRNMITLNGSRIASGPVLVNNVLAKNGSGGIFVGGDTAGAATFVPEAPVTVARIVNNTIYGTGSTANQSGIEVEANTSPTIISNIIANFARAINLANDTALRNSVVIGANLYQSNAQNAVGLDANNNPESFPIFLTPSEPLFTDAARDRYYLRALSRAIDSSIASLEDRNLLNQVRDGVGLGTSPIIAPEFDAFGLLRSDDPNVSTPGGLGSNVFADRGAIDRVDLKGPLAVMQRPSDNDSAGLDTDGFNTFIRLQSGQYDYFEILIDERQGTGPDPSTIDTVNKDNVILTQNGRMLLPGIDYVFGYSFNSRTIRLTPLAGFWRQDSVYEVTLINKPTLRIVAPSDAVSRSDGDTFTVTLNDNTTRVLELDSGFVLRVPSRTVGSTVVADVADGQRFTYTPAGGSPITFEFNLASDGRTLFGNQVITFLATDTPEQLAERIAAAVNPFVRQQGWPVQAISGIPVAIAINAASGQNQVTVLDASGFATGNAVSIRDNDSPAEFFTIVSIVGNTLTLSGNLSQSFGVAQNAVVTRQQARVVVGGNIGDDINVGSSTLVLSGRPGVTTAGATAVKFLPIDSFDATAMANALTQSLNRIGSGVKAYSLANGLVFIEGARAFSGVTGAPVLAAIQDLAGNSLQANRPNSLTQFTILMPEVSVDYGDAVQRLNTGAISNTLLANNGVRHALYPDDAELLALGTYADGDSDGQPSAAADADDFDSLIEFGTLSSALALSDKGPARLTVSAFDPAVNPSMIGSSITITRENNSGAVVESVSFEFTLPVAVAVDAPSGQNQVEVSDASGFAPGDTVSLRDNDSPDEFFTIVSIAGNTLTLSGNLAQAFDVAQNAVVTRRLVPAARAVDLSGGALTASVVASRLQTAILGSILDGIITGLYSTSSGDIISLGGTSSHRFNLSNSGGFVTRSQTGTSEILVQSVATLAAGQIMFLTDGFGNRVGFQVIDSASPTPLLIGNVGISVDLTTPGATTPASFATALAAAINQAVRDLKLKLPTATVANNAVTVPLDDEDGVQFVGYFNTVYNTGTPATPTLPATPAIPVSALVSASNPGFVDAWIDWNQDNDFDDAGERILSSEPVVAGVNTFFVMTPASAQIGFTTARFRISSTGGLFTNGLAIGGEVEDHLIEVLAGSPPIAVNDPNYEVKENGRLSSKLTVNAANGILANDFDQPPSSGILVYDEDRTSTTDIDIQPLVAPRFGDLKLNPDGSFEYTPLPHFNGVDSFVYRVTDSRMISANRATVTLTVRKVNDDPKAFDDVRTIDEDAGVMTTVGAVRGVREVFWTWADLTNNDDFEGITTIAQTGQLVGDEIFGYDTTDARKGILLKGANDRGLGSERDQNLNIVDVRLITPARLNPAEPGGLENVTIVNATDPDRSRRMIRYAPGRNYNNLIAGAVLVEVTIEDEELNLNGADPADNAPRRSTSTLTININPINDRPKVILDPASTRLVNRVTAEADNDPFEIVDVSADLRLFEDPGPQSIPVSVTAGPVTSATAGGADDENGLVVGLPGQNVSFNLSNIRVVARDPSLFLVQPTITDTTGSVTGSNVDRFLTFTLNPDVNSLVSGPILIDIVGIDDGQPHDPSVDPAADAGAVQGPGPINGTHLRQSVLQTLRLLVAPVNDVPFAADDIEEIDEDTSITISATTLLSNDYPGHNPSLTDPRIDNEERDNPPVPPEDSDEDQRIRIVSVELITSAGVVRAPKPGESLSWLGTPATGLSEIHYVAGTNYNNLIDGPVLVQVTIEDTGFTGVNAGDFQPPNLNLDPKQATSTLTININPMNDRPIVTLDPAGTRTDLVDRSLVGARLTLSEDPGPQSIPVTVTAGPVGIVGAAVGVSGGADDENGRVPANVPGQNISFNTTVPNVTRVRAIDPSLFSVQPTITDATGSSVDRVLTFTLAPDVNSLVSGPILIEIYGTDDGQLPGPGGLGGEHFNESIRQTLTLDIAPVNDAPFAADDIEEIDEDTSITISATTLLSNDYPGHNPSLTDPRIDNEERDNPPVPPEDSDEDQRIRIVSVDLITSAGVVRVPKPGELLSSVGTAATGLSEIRYTPSTNYNNLIDGPVLVLVTIEDTGVTGDTDPSAGNLVPTPDPKQATSTLTININAMNDRPIVTLDPAGTRTDLVDRSLVGARLRLNEDPGPQTIPVTVTAGPVGIVGAPVGETGGADDENGRVPANVPGQNISFNTTVPNVTRVRAIDPSLFSVQPTIIAATGSSVARMLTFTLAPDVNSLVSGPILIEIYGTDDGQPAGDGALGGRHENESVRQTLTLDIAPVNDVPFAADDVRTIDEDTSITISSTTLLSNDYPGHNPGVVPPRINNEERIPPETGDEDQRIRIVSVQLITSAGVVRVAKPGELLSSVGTAATGLSEIRYTPSTNYNNLIDGPVLVLVTIEDTGVTGDTDPSAGNLVPTPDPKQATSTLTININAMNDRPIVTLDPSMTMANLANRRFDIFGNLVGAQLDVLEDPGPQSIPLTVTAGPAGIVGAAVGVSGGADDENGRVPPPVFGQNVSFNTPGNLRVRALNPSLFRVQPTISPATGASVNRTLSFELAPDVNKLFIANPIQIVIFGLDDGQPAGDGSLGGRHENESVPLTLTLNVAPVNDAPEFTVPTSDINGNIIVESNEDEGLVTRLRFATDIRPGTTTSLVDEGVQSLVFDVLAFEPSVFAIQPTIDVDGTLSFQTAQDLNTKANSIGSKDRRVLVTLRDNGVSGPSPNTNVSIARTFTMVIKPTNDPPVPRSNYQVNPAPSEDTRITVQAADILAGAIPGPPDEVSDGQTLRVTNVNQVSGQGGTVLPDYGTDPDGVRRLRKFDYIPPLNFVGVDTITYILSDVFPADPSLRYPPGQLSVTGTITLTVQGINDPPEFTSGGNVSVVEDSPQYNAPWATNIAVGPPSATDEISGPNSQVIDRFEVAITNGRQDLFSVLPAISPDGVLTFTLAKDANGIATVSAVAVDNGPGNAPNNNRSRPVTFTINVTAVNDEPDFVVNKLVVQRTEDSGAVTEPSVLTRIVPAIGNNATPQTALDELTTQTVSITTRLKTGSSSLFAVQPSVNASGTLTFTTAPNQIGTAVFEVFATDSGSNLLPNRNTSAVKEFTIVISADNDAPTAVDDPYSTSETTVLTRNAAQGLLQNDIDPEGDPLAIASSATVSEFGAQVRVNVDGSFTYNPTNPAISPRIKALVDGQTLTDTFTYTARDTLPNGAPKPDSKESNVATVTVTVSGFNDAPVAVNDPFGVPFNTTRLLNVLANDFDVDTPINVASIEIGVLPVNGTATPTAEGRIRYTPRTDFRGLDTFTYRVRDSLGKVSNEATVTVRVNTAPVANPDSRLVEKNVATLIDVLSNDVDPDGTLNPATLQIVATPLQGTTTVVNGQIQFTPFSGFEGITTFQYVVSDNDGLASNTATVTVQVVASLYQNPSRRTDVNNDGFVSPLDALILINLINSNSGAPVPVGSLPKPDISRPGPPDFVDVNANGTVDPLDVLEVINFINSGGANGEGEGEGKGDASASIAPTGLAWSFLTGTTSVDTHAASLSNDAGNMMAGSRVSTLANAAQPLTNASWSSAQMSLADYLASLTDEEEELIDGALDLDLRTGDRDAIDDAFADLFGE